MAEPNPYQQWSAAPKHWVELPPMRQASPSAPTVRAAAVFVWLHREAVVTALALGAAAVALALAGLGASVADLDAPDPVPASPR